MPSSLRTLLSLYIYISLAITQSYLVTWSYLAIREGKNSPFLWEAIYPFKISLLEIIFTRQVLQYLPFFAEYNLLRLTQGETYKVMHVHCCSVVCIYELG